MDKEHRWLPKFAPHLPLSIPAPLAKGTPGEGYPWHRSVYHWLEGENATIGRIADPRQAATELARFIAALQRIDPTNGPPPGEHNFFRGVPLATRDAQTRAAVASMHGTLDANAVTAAWGAALQAPAWDGPPIWIRGYLQSGNLLAREGRLNAVIDFGGPGVGDPPCYLMVAWNLLSAETRGVFRAALPVDDATWVRGRGWALSVALIAPPTTGAPTPHSPGYPRTRSTKPSPITSAPRDTVAAPSSAHVPPLPGLREDGKVPRRPVWGRVSHDAGHATRTCGLLPASRHPRVLEFMS